MTAWREVGDFCINQILLFFAEAIPRPKASVMVSCRQTPHFFLVASSTFAVVQTHLSSLIHLQLKIKKKDNALLSQAIHIIRLETLLKQLEL